MQRRGLGLGSHDAPAEYSRLFDELGRRFAKATRDDIEKAISNSRNHPGKAAMILWGSQKLAPPNGYGMYHERAATWSCTEEGCEYVNHEHRMECLKCSAQKPRKLPIYLQRFTALFIAACSSTCIASFLGALCEDKSFTLLVISIVLVGLTIGVGFCFPLIPKMGAAAIPDAAFAIFLCALAGDVIGLVTARVLRWCVPTRCSFISLIIMFCCLFFFLCTVLGISRYVKLLSDPSGPHEHRYVYVYI